MKKYIVTLKHDGGKVKITTYAGSPEAAKNVVMSFENCPESAILGIQEKKLV